MTTLNTIIEEEKKEFDKRFMQDGELLTAFDGKDDASDIKSHLTTAIQRAYEAGDKKGREEERRQIISVIKRADYSTSSDAHAYGAQGMKKNILEDVQAYHSELDQDKK